MYKISTISHLLIAISFSLHLYLALGDFQTIPLNTLQKLTISIESPLKFKIADPPVSSIGTFNVIVNPTDELPHIRALLALTRYNCENGSEQADLPLNSLIDDERSVISFIPQKSADENCFQLELDDGDLQDSIVDLNLEITFSPNEAALLNYGIPLKVEFTKDMNREFVFGDENTTPEVFTITVRDPNRDNSSPQLQLKYLEGNCVESLSETSWLCYTPPEKKGLQNFALYNPGKASSYEITISTVTIQENNPETESQEVANTLIPGFGTLFKVNLPEMGVLKVKGRTLTDVPVAIIGASSLSDLLIILTKHVRCHRYGRHHRDLTLQNKQPNTLWYYFVLENKEQSNPYTLSSHFQEQVSLEAETRETYFIDPEIYEYKHIKLNSDGRQNYRVIVWTKVPIHLANVYYDTQCHYNESPLFPNQYKSKGKAIPIYNEDKIVLSLVIDVYDTVYLSIHALQAGFFTIQTEKLDPPIMSRDILIAGLSVGLITFIVFGLVQVYTKRKKNSSEGSNIQLATMLKRLEEQEKKDKLITNPTDTSEELDEEENNQHQVIEMNDEEKCVVCYGAIKSVAFEPCGHKCTCALCARAIVLKSTKCPLCRRTIDQVQIDQENREQG